MENISRRDMIKKSALLLPLSTQIKNNKLSKSLIEEYSRLNKIYVESNSFKFTELTSDIFEDEKIKRHNNTIINESHEKERFDLYFTDLQYSNLNNNKTFVIGPNESLNINLKNNESLKIYKNGKFAKDINDTFNINFQPLDDKNKVSRTTDGNVIETSFYYENLDNFYDKLEFDISPSAYKIAKNGYKSVDVVYEVAKNDKHSNLFINEVDNSSFSPTKSHFLKNIIKAVWEIPYERDWNSIGAVDYPRSVPEILTDLVCDCQGKTILMASVFEQKPFNLDTILISTPDHIMIGVEENGLRGLEGNFIQPEYTSVQHKGKSYIPIESTYNLIGTLNDRKVIATYSDYEWDNINIGLMDDSLIDIKSDLLSD